MITPKIRLLRKIGKYKNKERVSQEDMLMPIPDWLLPYTSTNTLSINNTSMELVTIDMIRMLKGADKQKMLAAWHDWKSRQRVIDEKYVRKETRKVNRIIAIRKDPEGFYAKQRKYHKAEQERKHSSPEWIATHQPKRKKTLEEIKATSKAWRERVKNDPIYQSKKKMWYKKRYYDKHKDIPGWIEKREYKLKRHAEILELAATRAQRRIERQKRIELGIVTKVVDVETAKRRARELYSIHNMDPEWVAKRKKYDKEYYHINREKITLKRKERKLRKND